MFDFGRKVCITAHTDSAAAPGVVHRSGLEKTKHIEVHWLWVRDRVHNKAITVQKIGTKVNPSDMMTKGLEREVIDEHVSFIKGYICKQTDKSALNVNALSQGDKWKLNNEDMIMRVHCKKKTWIY